MLESDLFDRDNARAYSRCETQLNATQFGHLSLALAFLFRLHSKSIWSFRHSDNTQRRHYTSRSAEKSISVCCRCRTERRRKYHKIGLDQANHCENWIAERMGTRQRREKRSGIECIRRLCANMQPESKSFSLGFRFENVCGREWMRECVSAWALGGCSCTMNDLAFHWIFKLIFISFA